MTAETLCLLAAGVYFMTALLTGWWKYRCIATSESASAPVYVDIAHRASLMYSFAAMLLREFVPFSPVGPAATVWVVAAPLLFFGLAIGGYVLHGLLRDTDNQLRRPHRLGRGTLPDVAISAFMWALAIGEIGGFAILLWGFLKSIA